MVSRQVARSLLSAPPCRRPVGHHRSPDRQPLPAASGALRSSGRAAGHGEAGDARCAPAVACGVQQDPPPGRMRRAGGNQTKPRTSRSPGTSPRGLNWPRRSWISTCSRPPAGRRPAADLVHATPGRAGCRRSRTVRKAGAAAPPRRWMGRARAAAPDLRVGRHGLRHQPHRSRPGTGGRARAGWPAPAHSAGCVGRRPAAGAAGGHAQPRRAQGLTARCARAARAFQAGRVQRGQ